MPEKVEQAADRPSGLRWNNWNLLLLLPLVVLLTPMINYEHPRLLGLPFFYWVQFAFVPIGVLCVAVVYHKTKDEPVAVNKPDQLDIDQLDEGQTR